MGSSNYVTFGDFNNDDASNSHGIVSAPPPTSSHNNVMMNSMSSAHDSYPFGSGSNASMELYDGSSHSPHDGPPRPARYPIRQQITYPRNPYVQPPSPPQPRYLDNPYYSYGPSPSMMESYLPVVSKTPPIRMPTTTPIHEAFTSSSSPSSTEEGFDGKAPSSSGALPFRSGNAWQGQTCVDINDHVVNCPICSQYYQNYSSMYIGIIILLGFIILIFLLKSIMEIRR